MITTVSISIILGLVCILIFWIKKKNLPKLETLVILFLNGSLFSGGIASVYLGLTGEFFKDNTLNDYRLWITISGLVMFYLGYKILVQEMTEH